MTDEEKKFLLILNGFKTEIKTHGGYEQEMFTLNDKSYFSLNYLWGQYERGNIEEVINYELLNF
jgi:hypothetical protein